MAKKEINLFTSNLQGKELKSEISASKKAVNNALASYSKAIDAAFTQVIKSEDKKARNVANAAKGKYTTALLVVANCFPYQTADGTLCTKKKKSESDDTKIWAEKKLTAAAARSIVRDSLKNFINSVGAPTVKTVVIGANCE